MPRRKSRKPKNSVMTKTHFYLNKEDEDKILLFTSGILFGVGAAVSIVQKSLWYGGLVAIALAMILLLIETR